MLVLLLLISRRTRTLPALPIRRCRSELELFVLDVLVPLKRARDAEPRVALGGLVEQWWVEAVHVVDVLALPWGQLCCVRGEETAHLLALDRVL